MVSCLEWTPSETHRIQKIYKSTWNSISIIHCCYIEINTKAKFSSPHGRTQKKRQKFNPIEKKKHLDSPDDIHHGAFFSLYIHHGLRFHFPSHQLWLLSNTIKFIFNFVVGYFQICFQYLKYCCCKVEIFIARITRRRKCVHISSILRYL